MESSDVEQLLADHEWLSRLAHALLGDTHAAEDRVQDTWLRALQRIPNECRSRRSWLAAVLHNSVRFALRSRTRRRKREIAAAVREEIPSQSAILDKLETAQLVLAAVRKLTPVYQEAILYHYWFDLSAQEIANKLEVPVATVNTRLLRAREKLRSILQSRRGDLEFSLSPLVADLSGSATIASSSLGSTPIASKIIGGIMAKKLTGAVLVVVVATLLYYFGQLQEEHEEPSRREMGSRAALQESAPTSRVAENIHDLLREDTAQDSVASPNAEPPAGLGGLVVAGSEKTEIYGRILAHDLDGRALRFGGCDFDLVAWGPQGGGGSVETEIQGEVWRAVVHPEAELEFREITIDEKPALARQERYALAKEAPMKIEVDLIPPRIFVVRDAQTREELDNVFVAIRNQTCDPRDVEPEQLLVERMGSPVTIRDDRSFYFVGALGYAWTPADVDRAKGGRYEVNLEKAAFVTISVRDHDPAEGGYVTLNRVSNGFVHSADPILTQKASENHRASHISPGEYEARLQPKFWEPAQAFWASTRVRLVASEKTTVELRRGELYGIDDLVAVEGTIRVERDRLWAIKVVGLRSWETNRQNDSKYRFLRTSLLQRDTEGKSVVVIPWRFEVKTGKYVLEVSEIQLREVMKLTPPSSEPIEIDLTTLELAELYVRVIDELSEQEVRRTISWTLRDPPGLPAYSGSSGQWDDEAGCYRVLSLPGRGLLSAMTGLRYKGHETVTAEPGKNEVTLRITPTSGVQFTYEHKGTRIPLPPETPSPELIAHVGEGKATGWSSARQGTGTQEILVNEPGRYRVDFTSVEIQGYEPIPERDIEIREGEWVEIVVELGSQETR